MRRRPPGILLLLVLVVAAACDRGGAGPSRSPEPTPPISEVGPGEGELNLLAFAGYAEDGSSDPDYDWVHPFERQTGCVVHVRYVDSGPEIVSQLSRNEHLYDGASVSGDVAGLLVRSGAVAPLDPALFRHADEYLEPFRDGTAGTTLGADRTYGLPALYGPNALLFDAQEVDPAPKSWSAVFDPSVPYAGEIALRDSPMEIAIAALWLERHRPELGISDPYELTRAQLEAATTLLASAAPRVGLWWSSFTDLVDAFRAHDVVIGEGTQLALSLLTLHTDRYDASVPNEGTTGWADQWMLLADAPHPNCMIRWMRWTSLPQVQAEMAIWYGGSPSNAKACPLIESRLGDFAEVADPLTFGRCGDEAFLSSLALWRVPSVECGDDRGRTCAGYPAWLLRWESIRG